MAEFDELDELRDEFDELHVLRDCFRLPLS